MINNFENPVAIFTSSDEADLECVSARRTHFNWETRTATYVWILKGHRGTQRRPLRFDAWQGPQPNQVNFLLKGNPSKEGTATVHYTDYKNCFVATFPSSVYGGQCMMWVTKEVEDNVPQDCIDQFEDICDVEVSAYNHDLCKDDDDDYEE
ncbi:uncharacterized protein LOC125947404 [Dermacentor silvarum]|uniref:uncharacterized protein LOC125947404 n=1 Tax=Dermacentor silvarum TaxID=543639 RepID=UPI002100845F|nr:uncharacterized protein LOC125947404 [Dermacentor silvarum]